MVETFVTIDVNELGREAVDWIEIVKDMEESWTLVIKLERFYKTETSETSRPVLS
jgi:hypothetical protein